MNPLCLEPTVRDFALGKTTASRVNRFAALPVGQGSV